MAAFELFKKSRKAKKSKSAGKAGKAKKGKKNSRTKEVASRMMNTRPFALSRLVSAPASTGLVSRSARQSEHIISVPFNSISNCFLAANAGTSLFHDGVGVGSFQYDLGPGATGGGVYQQNPFGIGISNVSRAYARYRVKRLRVTYVPIVSTAAVGSVILGATTEAFLLNAPSPQVVADCQASLTTPVWKEASIDLSGLLMTDKNPEWLYVRSNQVATSADQRQNYCCTLVTAGIGLVGALADFGYLRFDGVIEFTSLSDIVGSMEAPNPTTVSVHQDRDIGDGYQMPSLSTTPSASADNHLLQRLAAVKQFADRR